jgi:proline racemase
VLVSHHFASFCTERLERFSGCGAVQQDISGFGGEYAIVDAIYGHIKIARENIARVLEEKISKKTVKLSQAMMIAERILHNNPKKSS